MLKFCLAQSIRELCISAGGLGIKCQLQEARLRGESIIYTRSAANHLLYGSSLEKQSHALLAKSQWAANIWPPVANQNTDRASN